MNTKDIEFTNRYDALNIPEPDVNTMCKGQCEGTGVVPIYKDCKEPWYTLWIEAEMREHSDDGWHFVTCPECCGTGKKKQENGIERQ